jgi:hypothetical protein
MWRLGHDTEGAIVARPELDKIFTLRPRTFGHNAP